MDIAALFDRLWADYVTIAPQAQRVHALLAARGETIYNDHIALRTFDLPAVDLDVMARAFVDRGYWAAGDYEFPAKHLTARHYQHEDPGLPKVFISQLAVGELTEPARDIVFGLVDQVPRGATRAPDFVCSGRPWRVSHRDYLRLLEDSEYAAWLAAFGFRANHFTVDVGRLETVDGIAGVNALLQQAGFALNDAGGPIKGSPQALLEQSSTRAEAVPVTFTDGIFDVPSCYYEFARRYTLPGGERFEGFVTGSADRLFESTDVTR